MVRIGYKKMGLYIHSELNYSTGLLGLSYSLTRGKYNHSRSKTYFVPHGIMGDTTSEKLYCGLMRLISDAISDLKIDEYIEKIYTDQEYLT